MSSNTARTASPRPGILKQESQDPTAQQSCASPSSYLGLNYSPKAEPKSVSIAPNAETISPLVLGRQKPTDDYNLEADRSPRKPSVKGPNAHRLAGRPAINPSQSSTSVDTIPQSEDPSHTHSKHINHLIDEVSAWVRNEKERRARRKQKRHAARSGASTTDVASEETSRRGSESDSADDLSKLEEILKRTASLEVSQTKKPSLKHKVSLKKLHKRKLSTASSDTDYVDGDVLVPSCDVVLDNSKTMAQPGGVSESEAEDESTQLKNTPSRRDVVDAWTSFKFEIVRLTHTLRLKGWRRVPMDLSNNITVERLSGALTNAVYVVTPPDELPERPVSKEGKTSAAPTHKPPPPKLLLRIYGPKVEHLIDRDSELAILKRLARKRIGPRMLGTFANGRFEEYFHAMPLTPEELRNPDTSRQIAKRMRELHEGIELTDKERNDGPFVWLNWDKWEARVEQVVSWLDREVKSVPSGAKPTGDEAWKRRGLICGVEWSQFRDAVNRYRTWLEEQYGGAQHVMEQLVFAHNDTQYGNILRMVPTGESPLLLPANSHKQLVVIDFEYSNANLPGLEFANHFTEWCYNYHDEKKPYAINIKDYPTPEEQDRFVRAYVRHRPQFNVSTPKMRPQSPPTAEEAAAGPRRTTSSISSFMLDARQPGTPTASTPTGTDESAEKASEDAEVARLLHETRLWRLANTAQWVAWGIVQAKVPGMPEFSGSDAEPAGEPLLEDAGREMLGERAETYEELARTETATTTEEGEHEEDEEFDYLGYAQHRALFFWGDMLQLGLVKEEDVPEELRAKIKVVPY